MKCFITRLSKHSFDIDYQLFLPRTPERTMVIVWNKSMFTYQENAFISIRHNSNLFSKYVFAIWIKFPSNLSSHGVGYSKVCKTFDRFLNIPFAIAYICIKIVWDTPLSLSLSLSISLSKSRINQFQTTRGPWATSLTWENSSNQ